MLKHMPQYVYDEIVPNKSVLTNAPESVTPEISVPEASKEQTVETVLDMKQEITHQKIPASEKLQKLLALKEEMQQAEISYKDEPNLILNDGDPDSPVMFVGEAPGEQEVVQKRPFVGRSGQLLQEILDCAGIIRQNMYVTNVVVWRPPNNQTPLPHEIETMRPYLLKHIEIIQPKIIVLVGGVAYRAVMCESIAISKIRGIWQSRDFCPNIINIFHPSYLLRSPVHRKESWVDTLRIRQKMLELGCQKYLTPGKLRLKN